MQKYKKHMKDTLNILEDQVGYILTSGEFSKHNKIFNIGTTYFTMSMLFYSELLIWLHHGAGV